MFVVRTFLIPLLHRVAVGVLNVLRSRSGTSKVEREIVVRDYSMITSSVMSSVSMSSVLVVNMTSLASKCSFTCVANLAAETKR